MITLCYHKHVIFIIKLYVYVLFELPKNTLNTPYYLAVNDDI